MSLAKGLLSKVLRTAERDKNTVALTCSSKVSVKNWSATLFLIFAMQAITRNLVLVDPCMEKLLSPEVHGTIGITRYFQAISPASHSSRRSLKLAATRW